MRTIATGVLLAACFAAAGQGVRAQSTGSYPSRPVRLVLGYAPGGSTDILARVVAQRLAERWGVQVVVDNRPGGDTIIATDAVAKAMPDGYTLLLGNSTNATNPSILTKLPYDPVSDFTSSSCSGPLPICFRQTRLFRRTRSRK